MPLMTILETLLIGPLKLIFEIIYVIAERLIHSPGLAIVALSLVINVLMLPLHRRADAMQEESRDKEALLKNGVDHIKKTFSGDERMMILQTYYRQNDYKPTDVLNGSVSLLLEIPFFMAAYQFLSNLEMLRGVSFGPIADLGAPDGLLVIGGMAINVLPFLMTTINILSGMVYSKGFPLKTKIQMYGLAVFFLVVLYGSPSGLVFYWTLNNLFSLVKNFYNRNSFAKKAGEVILFAAGIFVVIFGAFFYDSISLKRTLFIVGVGVVMLMPLLSRLLKGKITLPKISAEPDGKLFLRGSVFMAILTGLLIPSTYIAASPMEFVDVNYYHNPLLYVLMSGCLAAGTFLIWMRVFYWLSSASGKAIFEKVVWVLCGLMLVNYMFFGKNLGMIYTNLQFAEKLRFSPLEGTINMVVMVVLAAALFVIICKWKRSAAMVLLTAAIAIGGMSVLNIASIRSATKEVEQMEAQQEMPEFALSQTGQNVVVIMLDRSIGHLMPYIFNEKPELQEQFDGFTHYDNTISHGKYTVFGSPSVVGGYEYTPVAINMRSEEALVDKHNEALKVMPVLFTQNGYKATLLDPVYANYEWIPDLTIFDEYPNIKAYNTNGLYVEDAQKQAEINANYRNFFCFSIMKCVPVYLQKVVYVQGNYNRAPTADDVYAAQIVDSVSSAKGYHPKFMDEYSILCNMTNMTRITDDSTNTFLFMTNNTTHEPMLLQTPDYVPAETVDNSEYDAQHADRFTLNGRTLIMEQNHQMSHYHANMAAMLQLGKWFDYLRENGVYDNTRIILVSDHGRGIASMDELRLPDGTFNATDGLPNYNDLAHYNALLMVKDFNSTGFSISQEFMTNADVPTLAVEGLIENPVNPFTGKPIDNSEKTAHAQYISMSNDWGVVQNDGNVFSACEWVSVKDSIWDSANWTFYNEKTVRADYLP